MEPFRAVKQTTISALEPHAQKPRRISEPSIPPPSLGLRRGASKRRRPPTTGRKAGYVGRRRRKAAVVAVVPVIAAGQASKAENKKKCAEEGHIIGDTIKRTEFRTKHPLCTKVLLSSTCP